MDEQRRRTGFSPPPLHQIKQRDPPEKGECVRVGVKGNAQERRDHERAMPGADRLPGQQNEKAGEGFWPGIDRLADEISIADINESDDGQHGTSAKRVAENKRAQEQQRIQDEADHGELVEGAIPIQFRDIGPVPAEVMECPDLRMIVRRAERGAKRNSDERHENGAIAHLVGRHDRSGVFE